MKLNSGTLVKISSSSVNTWICGAILAMPPGEPALKVQLQVTEEPVLTVRFLQASRPVYSWILLRPGLVRFLFIAMETIQTNVGLRPISFKKKKKKLPFSPGLREQEQILLPPTSPAIHWPFLTSFPLSGYPRVWSNRISSG